MRKIISDFRGRITYLVFSDIDLHPALPFGEWKVETARSLFANLNANVEQGLLSPILNVNLGGLSKEIGSLEDFQDFKKSWDEKSQQGNKAADVGLSSDPLSNPTEHTQGATDDMENAPAENLFPCYADKKYIRDRFLVLHDEPNSTILDNCFLRTDGKPNPILKKLLGKLPYRIEDAALFLEGGDILVANTLVLVGRKTTDSHAGLPNLQAKLEAIFGRDVYFPTSTVPYSSELHHLDLYLTVLGEANGKIEIAIGRIHTWNGATWSTATNDSKSKEHQDYLDLVRLELHGDGRFCVVEWPLLFHDGRIYSYNNCLVDRVNDSKPRLFLPSYIEGLGSAQVEAKFRAAETMFESHFGKIYDIRWVTCSFHEEVDAKASLRCLTQVLRRTTD